MYRPPVTVPVCTVVSGRPPTQSSAATMPARRVRQTPKLKISNNDVGISFLFVNLPPILQLDVTIQPGKDNLIAISIKIQPVNLGVSFFNFGYWFFSFHSGIKLKLRKNQYQLTDFWGLNSYV